MQKKTGEEQLSVTWKNELEPKVRNVEPADDPEGRQQKKSFVGRQVY